MLFNSYIFLVLFLPLALLGFWAFRKISFRAMMGWLVFSSIFYYGYWQPDSESWSPKYLFLILGSCLLNYASGRFLAKHRGRYGKVILGLGVTLNLALLGYYKYIGLFAKTFMALTGSILDLPSIILPLGISFFTFQQIAYLVDAHRGETKEYNLVDYLLFVTFFPQLIAGPIVHHKEMMPQFRRSRSGKPRSLDLAPGMTILVIGLFKKVVIADYLARSATPLFDMAANGPRDLTMAEAWVACLSYSLQIYFDFSGYSDMAIGAARLFGIRLPVNFHSPYKATSIIDFWRRWHVTLSRFLRDYLYIPLGGNRFGITRRYSNLFITMVLGGLWHGGGWTFLLWGALHGIYLCFNHAWRALRAKKGWAPLPKAMAIFVTFLFVILAWVPFRAGNYESLGDGTTMRALDTTKSIYASMFGFNGFTGWPSDFAIVAKAQRAIRPVALGLILVWLFPNTQQFMRRYRPALGLRGLPDGQFGPRKWWHWRPTLPWLCFTIGICYTVGRGFDKLSEFIYFQF